MINEILTTLFKSKDLENLLKKIQPEHLRDDLKQELFIILLDTAPTRILQLHDNRQLHFYATRIVFNMIASKTSPFYKKFRQINVPYVESEKSAYREEMSEAHRYDVNEENPLGDMRNMRGLYNIDIYNSPHDNMDVVEREMILAETWDRVQDAMNGLSEYEKNLFLSYLEHGSAAKMVQSMKDHTGGKHYIPKSSILHTVKQVKEMIKEKTKRA